MQRLLIYIKQKCSECFRDTPTPNREEQNEVISTARLLQLKQILPIQQAPIQIEDKMAVNQQYNLKNSASLSFKKNQKASNQQLYNSKRMISHEQFFSIQEFKSRQSGDVSRRSFKIGTLNKITSQSENLMWKSESSIQNNPIITDNFSSEQCKLITQTERLLNWIKNQYTLQDSINQFQVRHAIRLKMKGNGMMSLLIHKLEDFKVSYLAQSKRAFSFANKSRTVTANFQMNQVGSFSRKIYNVASYYRIQCLTNQVGELLRTFKSKEMLRILHNFTHVTLTNTEIDWPGLDLPIFTVKHQSRRQKKSRKLHIAWQMGQVQYQDQQGKQIFEIGFSLDEGDESWQRIIKYSISNKGYIQIYFQCPEQTSQNEGQSFSSRFLAMEVLLFKRKIIVK